MLVDLGMHTEGIYRLSGNSADIRLMERKFEESKYATLVCKIKHIGLWLWVNIFNWNFVVWVH